MLYSDQVNDVTNFNHLLELHNLAVKDASRYPKKRALLLKLQKSSGKHFTGITGSRGVGKTVLLKQLLIVLKDAFYLSLDTVEEGDLFEIIKVLSGKYGYTVILLDEIHYFKNYAQQLKKIYDFLSVKIIFTSSVSLSIHDASYDLARRVKMETLYPFCFREFLYFKEDINLSPLTFIDILDQNWMTGQLRAEFIFEEYLQGGLMPFMLDEGDILPILRNILNKIIQKDIPAFARLRIDELPVLEKILKFIGTSSVDGINYSSISRNLGITKYKAESYLNILQKAFVLHIVFPAGTNVLKEPKILMHLPYRLLYKNYGEVLGGLREDFVIEMLSMKNYAVNYLKSTRGAKTPDFLIKYNQADELVIEVGGRRKGREQFKGIKVDKKIIFTHPGVIKDLKRPLFLLGFIE